MRDDVRSPATVPPARWHGGTVELHTAGLVAAVTVMLAATVFGLWWRRRQGRVRPVAPDRADSRDTGALAALGLAAETPVTLVQFSSAFCAPCRTTRHVCADVAARLAGVRHVEVDAARHLEAVRALGVWRTPTVLVVDAADRVAARIGGPTTRAQVLAAVAPLLPAPHPAVDS